VIPGLCATCPCFLTELALVSRVCVVLLFPTRTSPQQMLNPKNQSTTKNPKSSRQGWQGRAREPHFSRCLIPKTRAPQKTLKPADRGDKAGHENPTSADA
jgi:hypothetical protein